MTGLECLKEEMKRRGMNQSQCDSKVAAVVLDILSESGTQFTQEWQERKDLDDAWRAIEREKNSLHCEEIRLGKARKEIEDYAKNVQDYVERFYAAMEECETDEGRDAMKRAQPEEPRTKLGDVYQIGQHRLICGDSTDVNVIDRLMDGAKADMVFTDPPYGVNVKGGKGKGNLIMGDLTQTAIPFSFEIAVTKCTKDKAHFYFCGAEANIQLYQKLFDRYLHILPKHLIWVKNNFVMKQNGYHNQFEIIFHGYKQGNGGLWYGGRTEDEASDVWRINRDASSTYLHPTQKPIGVPARAIKNSCPPSGSVVDLFGGSGSTLIACEQLNRKCYMAELDPKYCDVIIDRWEKFTGEKAVLLND